MAKAILIIDDYADDAKWLEMMLERTGVTNPLQVLHSASERSVISRAIPPMLTAQNFPCPESSFSI